MVQQHCLLWIRMTYDYIQLNAYCVLFSSRARVRIKFSVWLVRGYEHVFILLSTVIVPFPRYLQSDGASVCDHSIIGRLAIQRHQRVQLCNARVGWVWSNVEHPVAL